jgi:hypothetical protein
VPGVGWSGWEKLDGNYGAAPDVIGFFSGQSLDTFTPDAAGDLIQRFYFNGAWSGPLNRGGAIKGSATSASPGPDLLDIYARAADGGLQYHFHNDQPSWTRVDPTPLSQSPAATSDQVGHEYLFARIGENLAMLTVTGANTPNSSYSGWSSLGPIAVPAGAPAPVVAPPATVPLVPLTPLLSYNYKHALKRSTKLTTLAVENARPARRSRSRAGRVARRRR